MRLFSLGVHVVTGVIMAGNGILLLLMGLLTAIASGLFNGNALGIVMLAGALLVLAGAVYTFRVGFANSSLLQTDPTLYKAQELKLAAIALAFAAVATLVLFIFSAFSINNVLEHGFGWVLYLLGAVAVLNIISCIGTLVTVK